MRQGAAKASDYAVLAENHHGFEQRRSDGASHNGHSRGVDEQPGFDTFSRGHASKRGIAGIVIPVRQGRENFRKLGH